MCAVEGNLRSCHTFFSYTDVRFLLVWTRTWRKANRAVTTWVTWPQPEYCIAEVAKLQSNRGRHRNSGQFRHVAITCWRCCPWRGCGSSSRWPRGGGPTCPGSVPGGHEPGLAGCMRPHSETSFETFCGSTRPGPPLLAMPLSVRRRARIGAVGRTAAAANRRRDSRRRCPGPGRASSWPCSPAP